MKYGWKRNIFYRMWDRNCICKAYWPSCDNELEAYKDICSELLDLFKIVVKWGAAFYELQLLR